MKIDLSKGVEIGSYHYPILSDVDITKDLSARNMWGDFSSSTGRIRICGNVSTDQLRVTLLHELIEAVNEIYVSSTLEHNEITALGNGLAQALKSLGVEFVLGKEV